MRVKLILEARDNNATLPLNTNHKIAALIYKTIGKGSETFAEKLHEKGFGDETKVFKLFTFSRLQFRRNKVIGDKIVLLDPTVSLFISSPVNEFIEHFVSGLFRSKKFHIGDAEFTLTGVESVEQPNFNKITKFKAISPITESVKDDLGRTRYLTLDDEWSEIIRNNLMGKYRALHGSEPSDTNFSWAWDQEYLQKIKDQRKRASVLIDINGTKVRGWLAPFEVEGSKELIELGYEAGFGNKNSMGFGMGESV